MYLIIEIDGYYQQILLVGKKSSRRQVKHLTDDIKELPNTFCKLCDFEEIIYDNEIRVEFVIDTDTDIIYSPSIELTEAFAL